jgi:hypothetical protein
MMSLPESRPTIILLAHNSRCAYSAKMPKDLHKRSGINPQMIAEVQKIMNAPILSVSVKEALDKLSLQQRKALLATTRI